MDLDYADFAEMIFKIEERELDKHIWERWIALYPLMETGQMEFISVDDFKKRLIVNSNKKKQTVEEIYKDVDDIIEGFKIAS